MRILETERLSLRGFEEADAAFVCELLNDADWLRNIGDRGVRTPEQARVWIRESLVTKYWQLGFGFWAVERRSDGALLGLCGIVRRDTLEAADVGYAFVPRARGLGYAREAAGACVRYAQEVLELSTVLAITSKENVASRRVLESVGLQFLETRTLAGETRLTDVYALPTPPLSPVSPVSPERLVERDPQASIARVLARLFSSFDNRGRVATVASLPQLFVTGARVQRVEEEGGPSMDVREFVEPLARLLEGGGLDDFEEAPLEQRVDVHQRLAHAWVRYRRSGRRDGQPFRGEGCKSVQLVETAQGWKIAALAWTDDSSAAEAERAEDG